MASGDRTEKRLAGPTQLGTSTSALFTVPSSHQYVVKQFILCNTSGVSQTVTIAVGSAATAANRIVSSLVIEASETIVVDLALPLDASETLQGLASLASVVSVTVNGWDREI